MPLSDERVVTVRDEAQASVWVATRDDVAADIAGLRAVEAAVRADQIEKDAAIAHSHIGGFGVSLFAKQVETAIRAQSPSLVPGNPELTEGRRTLVTHPHDGHGPSDTCLDCAVPEPTDQTGDNRG